MNTTSSKTVAKDC